VRIAVVGAGVMGLATARALARGGHDVVVHEQFRVGHGRGSSHGGSRIFRLAYPEEHWVRLAQEALPLWRELEAESGETLLELTGLVEFVSDLSLSSQAALEKCGAECHALDAQELERRFAITTPAGLLALFQPEAGIVYANRALEAFRSSAERHGAELREDSPVRSLEEVEADAVVVTAGPWARELLAPLGYDLQVVPTRETVAYFRLDGPVPSVVAEITNGHGFYALRDPVYGLKVGAHKTGPPSNPDDPGEPDDEVLRRVTAWARERYELADPEPAEVDTCFYTNTADESFVLERQGRYVLGSACSGHGFKFAPAIGERLAALAAA
jgi:sarcosine oxidase